MSALTDAANSLISGIAEAVSEIKTEATAVSDLTAKNAELTAQLAAALAAGDTAQVQALQAESAAVAAQLVQATSDLHAAVDAAHAPAQAA